jgi:hypothetical protein
MSRAAIGGNVVFSFDLESKRQGRPLTVSSYKRSTASASSIGPAHPALADTSLGRLAIAGADPHRTGADTPRSAAAPFPECNRFHAESASDHRWTAAPRSYSQIRGSRKIIGTVISFEEQVQVTVNAVFREVLGLHEKSGIITPVSQPESSNPLVPDDAYYNEDWRLYYAERRRIVRRFGQFAAGAATLGLLFAVLPESFQVRHPLLMNTTGAVEAVFLLATAIQWFIFNWTLGGWTCPRCREPFFRSTLVRNPFGTRCRHCNLRRLKRSEVGPVSLG